MVDVAWRKVSVLALVMRNRRPGMTRQAARYLVRRHSFALKALVVFSEMRLTGEESSRGN